MPRREKTHETMTFSLEKETVRMLYEAADRWGRGFNISKYVNNAIRERVLRDGQT